VKNNIQVFEVYHNKTRMMRVAGLVARIGFITVEALKNFNQT